MKLNKMNPIELTEFIKENYDYGSTEDFYNVQDIIKMTDKLLSRNYLDRGKLLETLKEVETSLLKEEKDFINR